MKKKKKKKVIIDDGDGNAATDEAAEAVGDMSRKLPTPCSPRLLFTLPYERVRPGDHIERDSCQHAVVMRG